MVHGVRGGGERRGGEGEAGILFTTIERSTAVLLTSAPMSSTRLVGAAMPARSMQAEEAIRTKTQVVDRTAARMCWIAVSQPR